MSNINAYKFDERRCLQTPGQSVMNRISYQSYLEAARQHGREKNVENGWSEEPFILRVGIDRGNPWCDDGGYCMPQFGPIGESNLRNNFTQVTLQCTDELFTQPRGYENTGCIPAQPKTINAAVVKQSYQFPTQMRTGILTRDAGTTPADTLGVDPTHSAAIRQLERHAAEPGASPDLLALFADRPAGPWPQARRPRPPAARADRAAAAALPRADRILFMRGDEVLGHAAWSEVAEAWFGSTDPLPGYPPRYLAERFPEDWQLGGIDLQPWPGPPPE